MEITEFYDEGRGRGADILKFMLMPFVCIASFGFPSEVGSYVKVLCQFAAPAFYILCGFFMYGSDEEDRLERMKRGIKSSALMFFPMLIAFFAINAAYYFFVEGENVLPTFFSARMLFETFVLLYWPFDMGVTIWFIQGLFYAYVFFFILQKIKLFRFYKVLMVITLLATPFLAEFAGLIHFNFMDYNYVPIGFLTCTLPFMLLGAFIREKFEWLFHIPLFIYYLLAAGGIALTFAEMEILRKMDALVYTGQAIGLGITAFAICAIALLNPYAEIGFISEHGSNYAKRIYVLSQPVAFAIILLAEYMGSKWFVMAKELSGVLVFCVCFIISYFIGSVKHRIFFFKSMAEREKEETEYSEDYEA